MQGDLFLDGFFILVLSIIGKTTRFSATGADLNAVQTPSYEASGVFLRHV